MSKIKILYEDNHLLVAVKPAGFLAQADGRNVPDMLTWLKEYIKQQYNKPGQVFLGLVHRLDYPVSGVMVFARTSKAAARLSEQIRQHKMAKYYLAVVEGCPRPAAGRWQDFLLKDRMLNRVSVVDADLGQEAWLDYQRLSWRPDLNRSLLAIKLGSGRGHQIRVQLASRGYGLVGDQRYNSDEKNDRSGIGLFAASLGFFHPVSKKWLEFSGPLPTEPPWCDFSCDPSDLPQIFSQTENQK